MFAVAYGMLIRPALEHGACRYGLFSRKYDVQAKDDAGSPVTLGDTYGLLLVYNLFPSADGGVNLTASRLREAQAKHLTKMPTMPTPDTLHAYNVTSRRNSLVAASLIL